MQQTKRDRGSTCGRAGAGDGRARARAHRRANAKTYPPQSHNPSPLRSYPADSRAARRLRQASISHAPAGGGGPWPLAVVAMVVVVVELLRLVGSVSWPVPPSPTAEPGLGVRSEGRARTISVSDASKSYSDSVLRYCAGVSAYCIGGGGSDRGKGDMWVLRLGGWTPN